MKKRTGIFGCIGLILLSLNSYASVTEEKDSLPQIEIKNQTVNLGMEAYLVHEISDLKSANPWTEDMDIETLPVYRNTRVYDEEGRVSSFDLEQMKIVLEEMVERLDLTYSEEFLQSAGGMDQETLDWIAEQNDGDVPEEYLYVKSLALNDDGVKIMVNDNLNVEIIYTPCLELTDDLVFAYTSAYADLEETASYLQEKYQAIWDEKPHIVDINGGDYTFSGEQQWSIDFFLEGETLEEQIVNYNFHRTSFVSDGQDCLWTIRQYKEDLSEKVGDYPIINAEEAKAYLLDYKFWTTAEFLPEEEGIGKVDLIYKTGNENEYFIPYYRFWVQDLADKKESEFITYATFYVPAIEQTYIKGMEE